jgi:hypothetical protein
MTDIEQLREEVSILFARKARLTKNAVFWVKVILITFGAFTAGLAPFLSPSSADGFTFKEALGILGLTLVLLGGFFIIIAEEDTSEALDQARRATDQAANLALKADATYQIALDNEDAARRLYSLYITMSIARGTIEQAIADGHVDQAELIKGTLSSIGSELKHALGFGFEDQWTICVYRAEFSAEGGRVLSLIAHDRPFECDISKARKWPEGVGVGGIALAKNDEVYAPDLDDPAIGTAFKLDDDLLKSEDRDLYKSMFAVPVTVGNDLLPWGVVLATSDTPNYFRVDADEGVAPEEGIRALAGIVALAVSVCSPPDRLSPPDHGKVQI